jgi:hypothetical protein
MTPSLKTINIIHLKYLSVVAFILKACRLIDQIAKSTFFSVTDADAISGNTKGGGITVPLTSSLTGLN